jgi:hypothetical protein
MRTKISGQDQKWLDEVNKLSEEGDSIAKRSSAESAEYTELLLSNFEDKNYCQMAVKHHAIEAAIGQYFVEAAAPLFFDMQKTLQKKAKMSKKNAETCARIYVGRLVRNIVKELNNKDKEDSK